MPFQRTSPPTQAEQAVINAGYPWVQTNSLRPYDAEGNISNSPLPDRLALHKHSSKNTHLILAGTLKLVTEHNGPNAEDPGLSISSNRDCHTKEVTTLPGCGYRGWAGPEGCTFIEGHQRLSPTTAGRFEARGSHVWVDEVDTATRRADMPTTRERQRIQWFARERSRPADEIRPISMVEAGVLRRRDNRDDRTQNLENATLGLS